jgi:hypothetical protein
LLSSLHVTQTTLILLGIDRIERTLLRIMI